MRDAAVAYAYPRKVEFVGDLPKTLTGKIRRIELREREAQAAPAAGRVSARDVKRAVSKGLTVRLVNPVVRGLIERGPLPDGVVPAGDDRTPQRPPRRTPVGDGLRGGAFWVVTEHGWASDYVKNVQADPRVAGQARAARGCAARPRSCRRRRRGPPALAAPPGQRRGASARSGTEQLVLRIDLDDG